jgi:hypothetical protein
MNTLNKTYPIFEKGTRSAQYQQISNFCVNYTEGLLISLMHLEIDEEFTESPEIYKKLQKKLQQRERTIRHAFQFQIEKLFTDFKTVRRTRLHANRASDWLALGLTGQNASIVRASIEKSSASLDTIYEKQLATINERLKTLVHRSDTTKSENPLTPENLCNAFLSSVEALSFTSKQLSQIIGLYDRVLTLFLGDFYRQLDLGMYYLDILPELTDESLFQEEADEQNPPQTFTPDIDLDETERHAEQRNQETPVPAPDHSTSEPAPLLHTETTHAELAPSDTAKADEHVDELHNILEEFFATTNKGSSEYTLLYASFLNSTKGLFEAKQRKEVFRFLNFFTHLLDNPRLSSALKVQLSRLSQPLIKLVMVDPFFFRSSNHPVNDFIHSIIDYEIRYGKTQSTAELISPLLDQLLDSSEVTLDDFQQVIKQFDAIREAETTRVQQLKQNDEREQQRIGEEVLKLINEITEKLVVDPEVLAFFYDDWQLLLLQIARKIGQKSTTFLQSVEIARMLAWSLDEHREVNTDYSKYSFTSLLKAIDKGLISLNFSPDHRNRTRKLLVQEFKKLNQSEKDSLAPVKKSLAQFHSLDHFSHNINHFSRKLSEITQLQANDDTALNEFLDSLQYGSWVEIKEDRKSRFKRGKLKWKAQDNSRFIFIDQRGHKINESTLDELKHIFADERIKVLSKPRPFSSKRPTLGHGYTAF